MLAYEIFPLRSHELSAVRKFIQSQILFYFGAKFINYSLPDLDDHKLAYKSDYGAFWVAVRGDEIIGTIGLLVLKNGLGELRRFYVDQAWQSQGIGLALFHFLKDKAIAMGIHSLLLGTAEHLDLAKGFYISQGFLPISFENLPADFARSPEDTLFWKMNF